MTNNKIFSNEEKRDFAIKMKQIIKFCMGHVENKINEKIYHRLVSSNETNLNNLEQYNLLLIVKKVKLLKNIKNLLMKNQIIMKTLNLIQ